jgi:hypothetical protein
VSTTTRRNGRSGKQGESRNARVVPVFGGTRKRKKDKTRIAFAKILRGFMRKNKIKKRNVSPCKFEDYEKIYKKFWSNKKKVSKSDISFMVKLIDERVEDAEKTEG